LKALITGGAGFIGSHVAELYAERGWDVVVYDNLMRAKLLGHSPAAASFNLAYLKSRFPNRVVHVDADVRDLGRLMEEARDADLIVHAAAQVAVTTSIADPALDFEVNARGTFNVLEAARRSRRDPAVIYCSTNKVYGDNVNKIPVEDRGLRYVFADPSFKDGVPEEYPIDLCEHTPYGCSKLAGDLYAQDYARLHGLKVGVFRMSCIYGERQLGAEDQGWVAWLTIAAATNRPITIYGDGKQVRDVLYVKDLVDAYERFRASSLRHEVFNIGGGPANTLSLLELLELLSEALGRRPTVRFSEWRPGDQRVYVSRVKKLEEKLGWRPTVSPREGVAKLLSWVQGNLSLFK